MNELRDLWRITWQEFDAKNGPGTKNEGIWVMPFEASANMVVRDVTGWLGGDVTTLVNSDEYPLVREAIAYRMESGVPVEAARARVKLNRFEGGRWMTEEGFFVEPGESYAGWLMQTQNEWGRNKS